MHGYRGRLISSAALAVSRHLVPELRRHRTRAANSSADVPGPIALQAAARQTGQCCFEPFGSLPLPSALPSTLVHSGIAPRIGSMISVLRDDDGAQQNALAMTLPTSATSAKHVQRPRYPREKTIASKYAAAQKNWSKYLRH